MMRILFLDTETTALVKNSARKLNKQPFILEFCGIGFDEAGVEQYMLNQMFSHHLPIPDEVKRITGLTDEMLVGKPAFKELADTVEEFIAGVDRVVVHNLSYDKAVIDYEFARLDRRIEWPADRLCTVEATEHLKGHRLSLIALHELLFGCAFEGAHRAETDVRSLAKCYFELVNRGEI